MKMIGSSGRSAMTRFCRSRPFSPGREMSSTRQFGTEAGGWSRNACADANNSGCQPAVRIRSSSDSRTETSSSTTYTADVGSGIVKRPFSCSIGWRHSISPRSSDRTSGLSHRLVQRLPQRNVAEWLEKYVRCSLFECPLTDRLIFSSGNEDGRNLVPTTLELFHQIKTAHTWHGDIEHQTHGSVNTV